MNDTPIKVLLVEDNPGDARLIGEMLSAGDDLFELIHVGDLSAGLERLYAGGIDVILLDLLLPDSRGLATFSKAHVSAPQVPIIVLTGLGDEEVGVQAVREGAQDYLVKGEVDGHLLVRSVRYAIERKREEEDLRKAQDDLRYLIRYLQSVREEERAHIAREIHDDFGQVLTALRMRLVSHIEKLPEAEMDLRTDVDSMVGLVDGTIEKAQRIASDLRPVVLDDLGIVAAME